MTYFCNFGTSFISRERLNIETLNFANILSTRGPNDKNAKLGQSGTKRGHSTYFIKFWDPSISREFLKLETSNLARVLTNGKH